MTGLGKTTAKLAAFAQRMARLRADSVNAQPGPVPSRLREITQFGANPGNLRMFAYVPDRLPSTPALVVALHGCTQTAAGYDQGTGWSTLADRLGFIVIYPEQQPTNNPKNCFSWFLPIDTKRGRGEAKSIHEMVEHAIAEFGTDRQRVFVTGLSAGGAMASVMLATYPEVFAGGAIIAGLPYGCAASAEQAFEAMFNDRTISGRVLGDRVRAASRHLGRWPKISVWHGSADVIVKPSNADQIVEQWMNVHGLSTQPAHRQTGAAQQRREWSDATGQTVIEAITIAGMGHGVPVGGRDSCGVAGSFFIDVGICSTQHIARFWGLREERAEARATVIAAAPGRLIAVADHAIAPASSEAALALLEKPSESNEERNAPQPLDPNVIVATAFAAAGLPIPKFADASSRRAPVAPGPIIESALKAAGLLDRAR